MHRLTQVDYDLGTTQSEVFEYDDLGNRVTHQDERNSVTTLYTANEANEYLTVGGYTVAGLIKRNGTLVEANTYDAYGNVHPWGYRDFDFNRDGDVDSTDVSVVSGLSTDPGIPTSDPAADFDMDGDVDGDDEAAVVTTVTGEPPITLTASAVGNPYFFTGRRLLFYEDKPCNGICGQPEYLNRQIQYSRARWYNPDLGRWMQRDPLGYMDDLSLYEYAQSRATVNADSTGFASDDPAGAISDGWVKCCYYECVDGRADMGILIPQEPQGSVVKIGIQQQPCYKCWRDVGSNVRVWNPNNGVIDKILPGLIPSDSDPFPLPQVPPREETTRATFVQCELKS